MATRAGGTRPAARRHVGPSLVAALLALTSLGAPLASAADPLEQEITFSLPTSVDAGSTVTLEATADSGLPVALTSDTPETCAVEDGVLVALAPGTCTVTATQGGDDAFAAAPSVQLQTSIEAALDEPLPQVITFSLPSSILVGATLALDGTADSGLVVSYTADTPATCSVAGSVLTAVAPGACQVTASQAGDAVYAPAENVQASTTVEPQPPEPVAQTITFALPSSTLVGSSLVLGGIASSGLPVEYASTTPGVCSVSDVTLTALVVGTCSVTASQPGNEEFLAAQNVAASMAVEPVPQGVDLGKYAVNGPVHDVVIEPGTGRTFLGGDFTQIGVRTGPVAVVDPPDQGDGRLRPPSPEVLGTVRYVFADDRPGDPGFFIVGELIAVNGTPVPASPLTRMHLKAAASRWVVDTTFALSEEGGAFCSNLAGFGTWMATDDMLIVGGNTNLSNPVGLWFVDRATGECTASLPGIEQPLPILDGCSDQPYCHGTVNRMDWDPETESLYVTYITWIGETSGTVETTWFATRYNLSPATWSWTKQLQAAPGGGFVTSMALIDDRVLLRGDFWLDPGSDENTRSHLIALNTATGVVTQRWNRFGAQQLVGGATIGTANECFTSELPRGEMFDFEAGAGHWIGRDPALCHYTVGGGTVTGDAVNGVTLSDAQAYVAPTHEYHDGSDGDYLVGPWMAVALPSGDVVDWHPEPSTTHASTSTAISSAGIVIGGDFQFVRGDPAVGVAALTASLSPDPAFTSPLLADPPPTIRALALHDGWLLVGGSFSMPSEPGVQDVRSVVALDPVTGSLNDWIPSVDAPGIVETFAVNPDDGEFWVGGSSRGISGGPGTSLLRFEAPSAGAGPLPAPALTCLSAPILAGLFPSSPVCELPGNDGTHVYSLAFDAGGRLYVAGAFGAVNGAPRRGLARLNGSLQLDAWNADLLGAIPIANGNGLWSLEPYSIAAVGNSVIVGGQFSSIRPGQFGGGSINAVSPLFVFSASSGQLVRPTDPEAFPWFPVGGWWSAGYDIIAQDSGVVVALGDTGVVVLNSTTLDYDAGASAPFVTTDWWGRNTQNGIYALAAAPGASPSAVASDRTAVSSNRVVLAGAIPRWGNRVAGNVLASGIGNMAAPSATTPKLELRAGGSLSGTAVPIKLSWTASKGAGVALDHYVLEKSTNGGNWSTVSATIKSTSFSTSSASSGTIRFRVRAVNQNGIESSWATGPTLSGRLSQQTSAAISYSGTWRTASSTSYSGGSTRYTRTSGAKATYTFTGRSVALVTTKSPSRGKVKVYVNGTYVTTVDLYASASRYRTVAWQKAWTTSAKRTVTLVAAGPSSRPRIDLDAIAYVK